jgi:hypothetical protein
VKPNGRLQVRVDVLVAGLLLVVVACANLSEGPPTELRLSAASDTTIRIRWTVPGGSLPDSYVIAFMETGTSAWVDVGSATDSAIQADHNPQGRTGHYRLTAFFGSKSYSSTETPTSAPVHTGSTTVGELNSAVYPGFGWDRDSGGGAIFTMGYASNADRVDFYITDWSTGFAGPDYYAASPDWGPFEPGGAGFVPVGPWRPNGFIYLPEGGQLPLPLFDSTRYANNLKLSRDSTLAAVVCTDTAVAFDTILVIDTTSVIDTTIKVDTLATVVRHYALMRFSNPDTVSGTVQVETWFQRISDLRLIQH